MKKDSQSQPITPSKPLGLGRALELLGKGLLSLAIIFGAIFCLNIFYELKRTTARPQAKGTNALSSELIGSMGLQDMLAGNWVFADMPWSIQVQELDHAAALARLDQVEPRLVALAADEDSADEDSGGDLAMIAGLLEAFDARVTHEHGNAVYRADSPQLKVVAYAPTDLPKQVQVAKVMQDLGTGKWSLVEVRSNPGSGEVDERLLPALLPMPEDSRRVAIRMSSDRRVCGELYEVSHSMQQLHDEWRSAGWKIGQLSELLEEDYVAMASELNAAGELDTSEAIACTQGSEMVVVIPPLARAGASDVVLLIRPEG